MDQTPPGSAQIEQRRDIVNENLRIYAADIDDEENEDEAFWSGDLQPCL
jgi:hypothetical protein